MPANSRHAKPTNTSIEVAVTLDGIPCVIEGFSRGTRRYWTRIRSAKTGFELPPALVGLSGYLDVELRAEAHYRAA